MASMWAGSVLLALSVVAFTRQLSSLAYRYILVPTEEEMFTPCEEYPDNFLDLYVNLSGLRFERWDNYTIQTRGVVTLARPVPKRQISAAAHIFRYERGQWVSTIYNLCTALFSPLELWSRYTKSIPAEMRVCPFRDDLRVELNTTSDLRIDGIESKRLEGRYKAMVKAGYGIGPLEFVCFKCIMDVLLL